MSDENRGNSPCTVESTTRRVIDHKLLTSLEDGNTVAILASKQDLEDMIGALQGWQCKSHEVIHRRKALADGMSQLLHESFPG